MGYDGHMAAGPTRSNWRISGTQPGVAQNQCSRGVSKAYTLIGRRADLSLEPFRWQCSCAIRKLPELLHCLISSCRRVAVQPVQGTILDRNYIQFREQFRAVIIIVQGSSGSS